MMTQQPAQVVVFPYLVRDDDTPISELSEAEAVWVAKKEATWLFNQVATGRITEIPKSSWQCMRSINRFCVKHGYLPIDCDLYRSSFSTSPERYDAQATTERADTAELER